MKDLKTTAIALSIICFASFVAYSTYSAIDKETMKPLVIPVFLLIMAFTIYNLAKNTTT